MRDTLPYPLYVSQAWRARSPSPASLRVKNIEIEIRFSESIERGNMIYNNYLPHHALGR